MQNLMEEILRERLQKAILELDSTDKFRQFMLESLVQERDRFGLIDDRYGSYEDGIVAVYSDLRFRMHDLQKTTLPTKDREQLESMLEAKLNQFEDAALDLIFDKNKFFTKTKFGYPHSIAEFVGTTLAYILEPKTEYQSPSKISGRLAKLIMQHIEYEHLVSGEIKLENGRRYDCNVTLLGLLTYFQTENLPGIAYWKRLRGNEDLADTVHEALKALKDQDAIKLIPIRIKLQLKRLRLNGYPIPEEDSDIAFYYLPQEFGDAYGRFLNDSSNEFSTTLRSDIASTGIKPPQVIKVYKDGQAILLKSYNEDKGRAEVDIIHINGGITQYFFKIDTMNPMAGSGVPEKIRADVVAMIKGFRVFRNNYFSYLSQIKSK